jgi:hypothetical protein
MKQLLAAILAVVGVLSTQAADQGDVRSILDRYAAIRPKEAELGLYQLDWAPSLQAARETAAKEDRPIFLIVVQNSFGNICTGHC